MYNKKHNHGCLKLRSAFNILKNSYRKILDKIKFDTKLLPNVFTYCCLLHNLILGKKEVYFQRLLQILKLETTQGMQRNACPLSIGNIKVHVRIEGQDHSCEQHQEQLEIYLIGQ
jgi:hypothetical protein